LKFGERGSGNIDALGVGAGVRRSQVKAGIVDQVVGEGGVDRGKAFQQISGAKSEAEPQAFRARLSQKRATDEALGINGVIQVIVANVAYVLDVIDKKRDDAAAQVEELNS
jgi:hypothetical protein